MLSIKNLNAGYGELHILKDVDLVLSAGTMSILMGPNGAGKSTLLKSIFNLTEISTGSIRFKGEEITRFSAHKLLERGLAFVSQGRINFGTLSVRDNLLLGAHHVKDRKIVEQRLIKIYNQFPVLQEKENQLAFALSGGQQQMLAIGRALMSNPTLLLLDEPSLGLSPKLVKEVFEKIKAIRDVFKTTILIVEHNLKSLMDIADYGYVMLQGKIVAHDTCKNLKNNPVMRDVFVGKFE